MPTFVVAPARTLRSSPTGPTRIAWGKSVTQGLALAWPLTRSPREPDAVSGLTPTITTIPAMGASPIGVAPKWAVTTAAQAANYGNPSAIGTSPFFSVSLWVVPTSTALQVWCGQMASTSTGKHFYVGYLGGAISFDVFNTASGTAIATGGSMVVGNAYFIVATFGGDQKARVYVNGVLKQTSLALAGTMVTACTGNFEIGAEPTVESDGAQAFVQNVAFWKRELTPSEVQRLYAQPWALYAPAAPARAMMALPPLGASLTRSASTTITPSNTASRSGAFARSVSTTETPATTVAPFVFGRAAGTTVTPTTIAARSGGFNRIGLTTVTPDTIVTRVRGIPRSVETIVAQANTVVAIYRRQRAAATTVQPRTTVTRSAAYKRAPFTTITPSTLGHGVVIKLRSASTTVTPSESLSLVRANVRGALTSVAQSNLAGSVLTFGPTPEGALRPLLPVQVWKTDQLIFSGWITQLIASTLSPDHQVVEVAAQSIYSLLTAIFPAEVYEQMPVGVMLQYLLAYNLPGATVASIGAGPMGLYQAWETTDLAQVITSLLTTAILQNEPALFRFNTQFAAQLQFESDPFPQSPIQLTDSNINTGGYPI